METTPHIETHLFEPQKPFRIWYNCKLDKMHVQCEGVEFDADHLHVLVATQSEKNELGQNPPPRYYMTGFANRIEFNMDLSKIWIG